jgi:hypothetical protein
MTHALTELDAHEQPSDKLRAVWKAVSKSDQADLFQGSQIDDPRDPDHLAQFCQAGVISADQVAKAYGHLLGRPAGKVEGARDAPIYYHPILPGNFLIYNSCQRVGN